MTNRLSSVTNGLASSALAATTQTAHSSIIMVGDVDAAVCIGDSCEIPADSSEHPGMASVAEPSLIGSGPLKAQAISDRVTGRVAACTLSDL